MPHAPSKALRERHTFLLDQQSVLVVKSGRIDVFLVRMQKGMPTGRRIHLFRVRPGDPLVHMGDQAVCDEWGMLAVGTGATTIDTYALDAWTDDAPQLSWDSGETTRPPTRPTPPPVVEVIDRWMKILTEALLENAHAKRPSDVTVLEELSVIPIPPDTAFECAPSVASWVRVLSGGVRFLGRDVSSAEMPASGLDAYVPVYDPAWLHTEGVAEVTPETTRGVLQSVDPLELMGRVHAMFVERFVQAADVSLQREQKQFVQRVENRETSLGAAYSELAAVIGTPDDTPVTSILGEDPNYAAAQIVAQAMGITLGPCPEHDDEYKRAPLRAITRSSSVQARKVVLRDGWWERDNGPLFARVEETGAPVALTQSRPGAYVIHNPREGTRAPLTEEMALSLHPFAFTMYRPLPAREIGAWDLIRFGFSDSRNDLLMVVAMSALAGLLAMATPIITGMIFSDIIPGAERGQLLQLTLALIVCAIVSALFRFTQSLALVRVQGRALLRTQSALWDRVLSLPLSFFRSYSSGDLAQRAMSVSHMQRLISGPMIVSLLGGVFSVFNFGLLFYYSVDLALWATLVCGVALSAIIGANFIQIRYQRRIVAISNDVSSLVLQFLSGISKLRVAGAEAKAFSIWTRDFSEQRREQFKLRRIDNAVAVLNRVLPLLVAMVVFYVSVPLIFEEANLSMGHLLAFLAALTAFLTAAVSMTTAIASLFRVIPLYENAKPILTAVPEVDPSKAKPGRLDGDIEMQHVSFQYDEDGPLVLSDISIQIRSGEFVALVGPSGSGKSTIFKLLIGFESPKKGSIYYDDQDLKGLDIKAVRRQIGVVVQEGRLMPGDIFQNIAGASTITIDDAWNAARMAELHDDINEMPMGMHTVISEGGSTLSGGQVQRLMIARAVVGNPRIMFLDEATSALDNKTQAQISRSLERLNATRVVIAHRLSTIRNADRIIVLDQGQIVEQGDYETLMDNDGMFARLAKRQLA